VPVAIRQTAAYHASHYDVIDIKLFVCSLVFSNINLCIY